MAATTTTTTTTVAILLNGGFGLFLVLILWEFFLGFVFGTLQLSGVLGPFGAGADLAVSVVDVSLYAVLLGVRLILRPRFLERYRRAALLFLSVLIRAVLALTIIAAWISTFGISASTDGSDCLGDSFEMDCVIAFVVHQAYLLLYAVSFAPLAFAAFLVVQLGWSPSSVAHAKDGDGLSRASEAVRAPRRVSAAYGEVPGNLPGTRPQPRFQNARSQGAEKFQPPPHGNLPPRK